MMAALKSLSDNYNIWFILMLASVDCLFSFILWFSWFLVWRVIFFPLLPGHFGHYIMRLDSFQSFFFFNLFIIYFWLCWVFIFVRGLSLVAASGGHSSSRCVGLSLSWPLLLRSIGSRCAGSVVVAHGPSCSAACGILPDQGSNPCPLHWQADSQPLRHQRSPTAPPGKPQPSFFSKWSHFEVQHESWVGVYARLTDSGYLVAEGGLEIQLLSFLEKVGNWLVILIVSWGWGLVVCRKSRSLLSPEVIKQR